MRFGSVDMFLDFNDWSHRMGRPVANQNFLNALLTHGSFDRYTFFCPDVYHMENFRDQIDRLIDDPALRSRVEATLQITLAETIRENAFHVFHLGDFTYYMPFLAGIRNQYAKHPFPITGVTHSLDGVFMNLRYLELLLSDLAPYDRIICTSRCAAESVKKGFSWVKEKIESKFKCSVSEEPTLEQIPLGIEEEFFQEVDRQDARRFFKFPEDRTVALSVGRLSPRQKTDWAPILGRLSRMRNEQKIENLLLIIAGGGDESNISLLNALIDQYGLNDKVLLFENFPDNLKIKLYHAADFYISMVDNFQETFGLNIIEAMASGLPVIASNFNGYKDLIRHDENGFLINTLWSQTLPDFLTQNIGVLSESISRFYFSQTVAVDLDEFEAAVSNLYLNKDLRHRMGKASRQFAQAYQWPKIIHAYETLWAALATEASDISRIRTSEPFPLITGNPAETFSHYPSKLLSNRTVIEKASNGTNILKYDDIAPCLFPELESFLLESLDQGSKSIRELKKAAEEIFGATHVQTEFHILWQLKNGLIRISSTDTETPG